MNIVETLSSASDLSTLVKALKAANLVDTLSGSGPFTIFAPTNEAFAQLPKRTLERLLQPDNIKDLQKVLLYHVAPKAWAVGLDPFATANLQDEVPVTTVQGKNLTVATLPQSTKIQYLINGANILDPVNMDTTNGVVHKIDKVLLP